MPLMGDNDVEGAVKIAPYAFSNVNVNNLGADSYTLFGLILDKSSSVSPFARDIGECARNVVKGCQDAPRADNLMLRTLTFSNKVEQVHDFKLLADCPPDFYTGIVQAGGCTALYDASVNIIESVADAGRTLLAQDYKANGIVVIITDGEDVGSTHPVGDVKKALAKALRSECLESLLVILIGVNINDPSISQMLSAYKDAVGIDQYIEIDKADPKTFAKIAGFIVNSVSSQSQSLGTGTASKPIDF